MEARKHGDHRWATIAFDKVEFKKPVHVGDSVSFYTKTEKLGEKSVTVSVEVEAERYDTKEAIRVTVATVVMVSVDPKGRAIPFRSPPTLEYR
jgi:acyl-CoA thioesterase YciA